MTGTLIRCRKKTSSCLSGSFASHLKPALSRAVPVRLRLVAGRFATGLVLVAGMALVAPVVEADVTDRLWKEPVTALSDCAATINEDTSAGTRCLFGQGLSLMLDEGLRFANEVGQNKLGEHFQIVNNLTWSSSAGGGGLGGDLDTVMPFSFLSRGAAGGKVGSSLFFQEGITRSWDDSGATRNDLRHGLVHRFRLSGNPGAGIVGVSAFHVHNLEYGHQVVVPGVDYVGSWGTGSFRYFMPATSWRPARLGYEERALEGVELGLRLDLTTTLGLETTGYRWMAEDGSERFTTGVRMGIEWRPHPWLNLAADYDRPGGSKAATSFVVKFSVPLESMWKPPRWEGMGVVADGSSDGASDLWGPVQGVGKLRVATRAISLAGESGSGGEVQVRFLHDSVVSGDPVEVEVSLSAARTEDVQVNVRLVPGSGENPAVPGEDFVDAPVETTIPAGTKSSVVSIPTLRNDEMSGSRSLDVTASIAS